MEIPFLKDLANFTQLYKAPIVGGFFEDPNEAEKQRSMAAAANYFQQQRPEMVQTQMNMLNNRLSAYQGAADVMASMGLPTQGVQYAGVNPYSTGSYGANQQPLPDYLAAGVPGAMVQQQKNYDQLAQKNQPSWNPFAPSHPKRQEVPQSRDNGDGTSTILTSDGRGSYAEVRVSNVPGDPISDYAGTGNVGANQGGTLRPGSYGG